MTERRSHRAPTVDAGVASGPPVPWSHAPALRDHRWWPGRQHRRHHRRPPRRRGHADRARHRRRRRPPVGLHPVEGDDRHRRRAWATSTPAHGMGLPTVDAAARPRGACGTASTSIEARLEHTVVDLLAQPGRAHDPGHRPAQGPARGRGRHRRRACASSRPTPSLLVDRQPAPHPRLGAGRRRARAHHPRRLPAARAARAPGRHRLGRHRRRVRPHVLVVRLRGHADRQPPAGAAAEGPRGRRRARGRASCAAACSCSRAPGPRASTAPTTAASRCAATTAASPRAATPCWPSGRSPTPTASGLDAAGVEVDDGGYVPINHHCVTERAAHLRRRRPVGEAAAVVGGVDAGPQDRRARDGPAHPGRTATSTTTRRRRPSSPSPRSPTSGLAEADAFAEGRKIRVTKVPFSASAKALINNDPRGFVKILSDPATGVVLGGSIVGHHAAELISVHRPGGHHRPAGHRHRREPARAPAPGRGPGRRRRVTPFCQTSPAMRRLRSDERARSGRGRQLAGGRRAQVTSSYVTSTTSQPRALSRRRRCGPTRAPLARVVRQAVALDRPLIGGHARSRCATNSPSRTVCWSTGSGSRRPDHPDRTVSNRCRCSGPPGPLVEERPEGGCLAGHGAPARGAHRPRRASWPSPRRVVQRQADLERVRTAARSMIVRATDVHGMPSTSSRSTPRSARVSCTTQSPRRRRAPCGTSTSIVPGREPVELAQRSRGAVRRPARRRPGGDRGPAAARSAALPPRRSTFGAGRGSAPGTMPGDRGRRG